MLCDNPGTKASRFRIVSLALTPFWTGFAIVSCITFLLWFLVFDLTPPLRLWVGLTGLILSLTAVCIRVYGFNPSVSVDFPLCQLHARQQVTIRYGTVPFLVLFFGGPWMLNWLGVPFDFEHPWPWLVAGSLAAWIQSFRFVPTVKRFANGNWWIAGCSPIFLDRLECFPSKHVQEGS